MKAAGFYKHGSVDELTIFEIDRPKINYDDVLVEVKAFALNRLDIWTREGMPSLKLQFPHIGASDFSGIVVEMGNNVKNVNIGDRVLVNAGISCRKCKYCIMGENSLCKDFKLLGEHIWGGSAEYARVPATNILRIPDNIDFINAAAIPLTALTAYRMIVSRAKISPGDNVLVIGAGGGIGTVAIQISSLFGGNVYALTSSTEKEKIAYELGAYKVINYKSDENWDKTIYQLTEKNGIDIVIDSTGEKVWKKGLKTLAKGGRYVTCGATSGINGQSNIAMIFWKQLSILGSTMASDKEFVEAMQLFFKGKIKPVVDSIFEFDQIKKAHKRLQDPDHIGKIVVKI